MAALPTDLQQEEARLAKVLAEIKKQLDDVQQVVQQRRSGVLAGRREMWQDLPSQIHTFEDLVIMSQHALIMGELERDFALYQRILRNLERMYRSPYFGRVDFKDNEFSSVERIYIGISSLTDSETGEHLVYDWRAPVSSMFYDAEPGPASYVCDAGVIEGELLLKRQYNIENGKLLYFFDTSLKIDDDVLQEMLAKHADDKMRSIVTSIQREQNRIIRDEEHPVLIVQGPAGSGKTSIALHRAAYLLYRFRGKLAAENLLIFSPNEIFSDYISNVLPELGEEPINQVTFTEYARRQLGSGYRLESMEDQLEFLFTQRNSPDYDTRVNAIRFKTSEVFLQLLHRYVRYLETGAELPLKDVQFHGRLVMDRAEMLERLRNRYSDMPYLKRVAMLQRRIRFLLEEPVREAVSRLAEELAAEPDAVGMSAREIKRRSRRIVNAELRNTLEEIAAWDRIDAFSLYRDLFEKRELFYRLAEGLELPDEIEKIRRATLQQMQERRLPFEDVAPLLYLRLLTEGAPASQPIRHVIVDEAQDYSIFHYHVMRLLFPGASFTILGDMNQSVHPYMNSGTYDAILQTFAEHKPKLIRLQRTYRSTLQIAEFTRAILGSKADVESVQREGLKPRLRVVTKHEQVDAIVSEVHRLVDEGLESIALICRTAAEAEALYERLSDRLDLLLIRQGDTKFRAGIVLVPVYLAKGLEFDGVLICDAGERAYSHESERKAFYTACTRALHRLCLISVGPVSPFIPDASSGLWEKVG